MRIVDNRILDEDGRALILRGVNLGGNSKTPFGPPGWALGRESLANPAGVSFVGRPFPLDEAASHFERLNRAGFTFLRLLVTWEALEHAGPGLYDEEYLAYLRKILLIAGEKGIKVFIDPHQDVWSRWTGGDGAPAWTLEKLGIDLDKLDACGAAVTRQRYSEFHGGKPFPRMVWPSNYNRYAAATMFTLFFGGKTYAPGFTIDGENVQDWLQGRYIAAFRHCYRRLKNCTAIAGWGVMNEPHNGFIGCKDLFLGEKPVIPSGPRPSPWDAIRAAAGYTVKVPVHAITGAQKSKSAVLNPGGHSLFREGASCPWKQAGIWTDKGGEPQLVRADYFARHEGRAANFMEDFHRPFTLRFMETMKEADENAFFFIEGMPNGANGADHPAWKKDDPPNAVNAFHWYDGFALFTKHFRPWFTVNHEKMQLLLSKRKVQKFFTQCLEQGVAWSRAHMNNIPCLLGEFGLAFDMNNRSAFATGDYSPHEEALSMYYNAVDANLLHSTIWNYTADNVNKTGDGWNDEDLSIFAEGKERAAAGWKRPYPMATAGNPVLIEWNRKRKVFCYRYSTNGEVTAPTVIYLPAEQFGPQVKVTITPPLRFEHRHEEQRLLIFNDGFSGEAKIVVKNGAKKS